MTILSVQMRKNGNYKSVTIMSDHALVMVHIYFMWNKGKNVHENTGHCVLVKHWKMYGPVTCYLILMKSSILICTFV